MPAQVVNQNVKKLLAHICCAPCATVGLEKLINDNYEITGYFYNPNIHPESEYTKRLDSLKKLAGIQNYKLITESDPPDLWFEFIKGLEKEKEGGKRCEACFRMRLEKTAFYASRHDFEGFTTVLTVSPHKNTAVINRIGKDIAEKYNLFFPEENFKKQDGFKKSMELSKKYGLYRQNYCGCVYSCRQEF